MAQATLLWVPYIVSSPSNASTVTGQKLEYRDLTLSTSQWIPVTSAGTLQPGVSSYIITNLLADVPYEFRVITICNTIESPTTPFKWISISCPTLSFLPTARDITVSFTPLTQIVSSYILTLYDGIGNVVLAGKTLIPNGLNVLTHTFSNLTPNTSYSVQLTTLSTGYRKQCPIYVTKTLTNTTENCPSPIQVTAELSD